MALGHWSIEQQLIDSFMAALIQQDAGAGSVQHNGMLKGTDPDDAGTNMCSSHHKNDSGSYDTSANGLSPNSASGGLSSSAGVTILVSNGESLARRKLALFKTYSGYL